LASRASEPDDTKTERPNEDAAPRRIVDVDRGEVVDVTSVGDVSVVRKVTLPRGSNGASVTGIRGRQYAYTPRRARPPWVKPDVLVLGDDLPNYLRAERTFHPLTEAGLKDLIEAPARLNSRRASAPIVAVPSANPNGLSALVERLEERGIPVMPLRDVVQQHCRLTFLDDGDAEMVAARPRLWRRAATRAVDIILGLIGCAVLAALYPFIATAIFFEDKSPILYVQDRIGRGGRIFRLYKFRSMRANAEETGPVWATLNDERVTRVGAVLRRFKLDELPQFVNVLIGDMSIVGPRPERPVFVDTLRKMIPHYDVRHSVRPGLTGWGTLRVGYGNSIEAKYLTHQYDLYHLRYRTLRFDLEVITRSAIAILLRADRQDRFML
jgi:lipopolysaccharide/colanic/teichoic acid biosynthesis glycosyltransferase